MANHLRMAVVQTIISLHERGWSQRRIAQELGINRETVARHLQQAATDSNPAIALPGLEALEAESKPAIALPGSEALPDEADSRAGRIRSASSSTRCIT